MKDNILIPFIISLIAGLSTLLGCIFIFVNPKNTNKFIGVSLAFSATIMILISIFELIPDGFFYLKSKYGGIYAILTLILMILIGYLINVIINQNIAKNHLSCFGLTIASKGMSIPPIVFPSTTTRMYITV